MAKQTGGSTAFEREPTELDVDGMGAHGGLYTPSPIGGPRDTGQRIEVPHEPEVLACVHVIQTFLSSGSRFLAQADWGCEDGNHSAWMIVDVDSREDARTIVPPPFRLQTRISELNKFTMDKLDEIMRGHGL